MAKMGRYRISTKNGIDSRSQLTRLVILIAYLALLFLASKLAFKSWLPPTSEKGLWFYSGLAALLLGNLLVTPFFTKPVDAIANAVAAFVALLAVNILASGKYAGFDQFCGQSHAFLLF
jgi:hypothetical protein